VRTNPDQPDRFFNSHRKLTANRIQVFVPATHVLQRSLSLDGERRSGRASSQRQQSRLKAIGPLPVCHVSGGTGNEIGEAQAFASVERRRGQTPPRCRVRVTVGHAHHKRKLNPTDRASAGSVQQRCQRGKRAGSMRRQIPPRRGKHQNINDGGLADASVQGHAAARRPMRFRCIHAKLRGRGKRAERALMVMPARFSRVRLLSTAEVPE